MTTSISDGCRRNMLPNTSSDEVKVTVNPPIALSAPPKMNTRETFAGLNWILFGELEFVAVSFQDGALIAVWPSWKELKCRERSNCLHAANHCLNAPQTRQDCHLINSLQLVHSGPIKVSHGLTRLITSLWLHRHQPAASHLLTWRSLSSPGQRRPRSPPRRDEETAEDLSTQLLKPLHAHLCRRGLHSLCSDRRSFAFLHAGWAQTGASCRTVQTCWDAWREDRSSPFSPTQILFVCCPSLPTPAGATHTDVWRRWLGGRTYRHFSRVTPKIKCTHTWKHVRQSFRKQWPNLTKTHMWHWHWTVIIIIIVFKNIRTWCSMFFHPKGPKKEKYFHFRSYSKRRVWPIQIFALIYWVIYRQIVAIESVFLAAELASAGLQLVHVHV